MATDAKYIMALDAGTTSNRCILFNKKGEICSIAQKEFEQIYPSPGWVEHDATEIFDVMLHVAKIAMKNVDATAADIAAIGIANQRETTIVWDKQTGKPIYNAIVWQCRRTAKYCDELKNEGWADKIQEKTGLIIDAYFSATKIKWILDNVDGARQQAQNGNLLFGSVETWLIWNLTKGAVHVSDVSNASRTMLFNINEMQWDDEILEKLDIPKQMLPYVVENSCVYGQTSPTFFGAAIDISGAAGDQQAALFGQCCFVAGDVKNTYGTGCFTLANTGDKPYISNNGLVSTVAWKLNGKTTYALEGSVFIAGAAIQWLRDELKIISSSSECERLATRVQDTHGCYVVPAFTGLGAPYWDQYATGEITGITRGVNCNHIVRATLDSIAYQVYDLLETMVKDTCINIATLNVDGGASSNNYLMQMQSDLLNVDVIRPQCVETTALGAAYLAGLAVGFWDNLDEIKQNWKLDKKFSPDMTDSERNELLAGWKRAVNKCRTK